MQFFRRFFKKTVRVTQTQTTVNGKPATPEQEKQINEVFKEADKAFEKADEAFDHMGKAFERLDKVK